MGPGWLSGCYGVTCGFGSPLADELTGSGCQLRLVLLGTNVSWSAV